MKNLFWFGVAAILTLHGCSGCKKDFPNVPISDQRLIDAVDFKPGSYFVYQDSASGEIDSFGVDNYFQEYLPNQDAKKNYQEAGYDAEYLRNPLTSLTMTAGGVTPDMLRCLYWYKDTMYAEHLAILKLPFVEGYSDYTGGSPYTCVKYYPTFQVGINNYSNVYEMISNNDFHSYYSISSGLIKFSLTLNGQYHSWNLVRGNIVKQ